MLHLKHQSNFSYYVQLVIEISLSRLYHQMVNRSFYVVIREKERKSPVCNLKGATSKYCNAPDSLRNQCRDKSFVKSQLRFQFISIN